MRPQGAAPEILVLDNHKDNPVLSTDVWHSDTTFRQNPTKYTILRCQIMPKVGGDTLWADMEAAYEGLSPTLKSMIGGLKAVHDFKTSACCSRKPRKTRPSCAGWRSCFLTLRIRLFAPTRSPDGNASSSTRNLQFASRAWSLAKAVRSWMCCSSRFMFLSISSGCGGTPGTIVFWDNQSTQHYAANDYYPERRRMERTAIVGDVPF